MRHADPSTPVPPHLSDEERALHLTFSPEFILAQFRAFQDGGCRDQTFYDNGPFFVESLLRALSTEREAGEEVRALHNVRNGMATPGMYVRAKLAGSGTIDLSWWAVGEREDECLAEVDDAFTLTAAVAEAMKQVREDSTLTETPHAD